MLVALLHRDGAVATRVDLIQEVWGYPASVVTRTVDTHVAELRRKLEDDPGNPTHILTVPRVLSASALALRRRPAEERDWHLAAALGGVGPVRPSGVVP